MGRRAGCRRVIAPSARARARANDVRSRPSYCGIRDAYRAKWRTRGRQRGFEKCQTTDTKDPLFSARARAPLPGSRKIGQIAAARRDQLSRQIIREPRETHNVIQPAERTRILHDSWRSF